MRTSVGIIPKPPICGECGKPFIRAGAYDDAPHGSTWPTCEHYEISRGYLKPITMFGPTTPADGVTDKLGGE